MYDTLQNFLKYTENLIELEDIEALKTIAPHYEALINKNQTMQKFISPNINIGFGCICFYLGNYAKAKNLIAQNLYPKVQSRKKQLWTLRGLTYLGAVHISLGNQELAESLLKESIKGYEIYFPKHHIGQAQALRYLATSYRDLGKYQTAKNLFEKSLFIYQNHLSKNYVGLARALGYVGDIHRELGNYEKAKLYLEKSYYLYKNHFPNNKPGIVWNLAHLGEIYGILGYTDKAKTILEECLGICKDHLSENHAYYPWISGCLGTAYCELGLYGEAKRYLTQSASLFKKNFAKNGVYYAWASWHLGVVYGEMKNFKKANFLLSESLKFSIKKYGEDSIEVAFIFMALARIQLLDNKLQTSKMTLKSANNLLKKHDHASLCKSLEMLAEVYMVEFEQAQFKKDDQQSLKYAYESKINLRLALKAANTHFPADSPHIVRLKEKLSKMDLYH